MDISVEEELRRLEAVRNDLRVTAQSISVNALGEASSVLIGTAETKDEWGALYEQLHNYNALMAQKGKSVFPDPSAPYFARLSLEEPGHARDVLIGYGSLVGAEIYQPIVDWKKAPVGKLFFRVKTGEFFEQELPSRLSRGKVRRRWLYGIKGGTLKSIWCDSGKRLYRSGEAWCEEHLSWVIPFSGGEGKSVRQIDPVKIWGDHDEIEVKKLLDENQRQVLEAPRGESLLVLGGAGSGKTTVALLRMAKYVKFLGRDHAKNKALVLVPHEGLKNLCMNLLWNMNVIDVPVFTYDDWVAHQGSLLFQGLPKRVYHSTSYSVRSIKRSKKMLSILDAYIHGEYLAMRRGLKKKFPYLTEKVRLLEMKPNETLLKALDRLQTKALEYAEEFDRKPINHFFARARTDLYDFARDRIDLFSNRDLLWKLIDEKEKITESMVRDLISHSRGQFHNSFTEIELGEDVDNHLALDGKDETKEDEEELYKSIDVDDFTIMFHLLLKKTGSIFIPGGVDIQKLSHMMIDEAQELSEGELKILGLFLEKDGSVTISGDEGQLTTSEDCFKTWEDVLSIMGLANVGRRRLMTNYRSSRAVADLGMHVLRDLAKEMPIAVRDGLPVFRSHYDGYGIGLSCLADTVRDLVAREPAANVAVIVREEKTAKTLAQIFEEDDSVRIVLDGKFNFDPGVDITTLDEVKGLEFDYVIIPDAHSFVYRNDNLSKRAMYVAITRAVHGLWIYSTATQSPLLTDWSPTEKDFVKWLSPSND